MSLFCCKKRNICFRRKSFWVNSYNQLYERPLQSCFCFKIVIQRVKSFKKWFWSWMDSVNLWLQFCNLPRSSDILWSSSLFWSVIFSIRKRTLILWGSKTEMQGTLQEKMENRVNLYRQNPSNTLEQITKQNWFNIFGIAIMLALYDSLWPS